MSTASDYNREGNRFSEKGDYLKAVGSYKKAVEMEPDNAEYVYNTGKAYLNLVVKKHSNYRFEAREYLLKADSMGYREACFDLGTVYDPTLYDDFVPTANENKALEYYKRYLDQDNADGPEAAAALNNIGCIYGVRKGKYFEACAYTYLAGFRNLAMGRKNYDYFKKNLTGDQVQAVEAIRSYGDLKNCLSGGTAGGSQGLAGQAPGDQAPEDHRSLDDLMAELNDLVGLQEVKKEVSSLINLLQIAKVRKERGLKVMPISLHLVFTGNPGTGKTTVARLLAGIYRELGVLSKGQLVEVDRSELVAGYVGQTAIKTQNMIDEAKGGILFIDEAYTLIKEGNDFGQEAVDTLLKEMEDNRENLVVIVAGYTELMENFLNSNPGLRSRFNKFIHFNDYSADELYKIFTSMCDKAGYRLGKGARAFLKADFATMIEKEGEHFANGRSVRNYFEAAVVNQANRLAKNLEVSNEELVTLKIVDFKDVIQDD